MIEEYIKILVRKIYTQEINPNTNQVFKIEDIKIQEYRDEVKKIFEQGNIEFIKSESGI